MAKLFIWHDFAAHLDSKMIGLRQELGVMGYGAYWILLERLASENSHTLPMNFAQLAWDMRIEPSVLQRVVCDFGLFEIDEEEGTFHSERLTQQLEELENASQRRREAGRKGGLGKAAKFKEKQLAASNAVAMLDGENSSIAKENQGESLAMLENASSNARENSEISPKNASNARENEEKTLAMLDGFEREKRTEEKREKEKVSQREKESKEEKKKERDADAINNININTARTREETTAAATSSAAEVDEFTAFLNSDSETSPRTSESGSIFESWRLNDQTYSPEFLALCDEFAAQFNLCDGRVYARQLEALLFEVHSPRKDGIQFVQEGLAKLKTARAVVSGKVKITATKFLKPDIFLRLVNGDYDEDFASARRRKSRAADAGVTFSDMEY